MICSSRILCSRRSKVGWLFLACLATLLSVAAQAQFIYRTENGTITIIGYTGSGGAINIPAAVNYMPVTSIGPFAFEHNDSLLSVTIPDSVTSIGYFAFRGCTKLTNVAIGNGVTSIGDSAFKDNVSLVGVSIPDSVTSIGAYVFHRCTKLTTAVIGNGVTSIGYRAFEGCTKLTNVVIGNGVTSIETAAFAGCRSLTSVMIPDSVTTIMDWVFSSSGLTNVVIGNGVTSIGPGAFAECLGLSSVTIPNSVTRIHSAAFYGCTSLANVLFGDGVISIGEHAFAACFSLTSVTIGAAVTNIEYSAFSYCVNLTNVTIPNSVTRIGHGVFHDCTSLISITVDANNPAYSSLDGVLFNQDQTKLVQFPQGKAGSYTIPDSVTAIGDWAFSYCYDLTGVTVGNSVTNIGDYAFGYCRGNLKSVYFKANAPTLGSVAFLTDENATIYYLPGTTGWSSTFGGRPTALWLPQIVTSDNSFGVQTNQFGFRIAWASGQPVVVEASTNLANPVWSPLQTNILAGDTLYFSDPRWTDYPARFYRIRSQ